MGTPLYSMWTLTWTNLYFELLPFSKLPSLDIRKTAVGLRDESEVSTSEFCLLVENQDSHHNSIHLYP